MAKNIAKIIKDFFKTVEKRTQKTNKEQTKTVESFLKDIQQQVITVLGDSIKTLNTRQNKRLEFINMTRAQFSLVEPDTTTTATSVRTPSTSTLETSPGSNKP